jgi:peptidoglycan/LPS O-acetylase OafA/YrhL
MFLYVDQYYSGWPTAAWHGVLSVSLIQAWFPMHAEVWNAPTWFLSALNVATAVMPFCLPAMATMTKSQLTKTGIWLFLINFLPKLGYMYDLKAWNIFEGVTPPKAHPNLALFNEQRFSPLHLIAEVLLGAVACRLVMLDNAPDEKEHKTNALSTAVPLAGMAGIMVARAAGVFEGSDLLVRSVLFIPLFLRFIMAAHRNTANKIKDPIVSILSNKFLVALGGLSFPIYIVHGPIGQLFFKKLVANKLWGKVLKGPANFGIYLATVVAAAWVLQKTFLSSKAVKDWSKSTVDQWSEWF